MNLFHAFLLGIIQSLTEFSSVSSSVYLPLLEWIENMENQC